VSHPKKLEVLLVVHCLVVACYSLSVSCDWCPLQNEYTWRNYGAKVSAPDLSDLPLHDNVYCEILLSRHESGVSIAGISLRRFFYDLIFIVLLLYRVQVL